MAKKVHKLFCELFFIRDLWRHLELMAPHSPHYMSAAMTGKYLGSGLFLS